MNEQQLIDEVCAEGIASVKKHEKGAKRRGGLKGFEIASKCSDINEVIQFLQDSQDKDTQARIDFDNDKITADEYWEQRYITLQLEHVFKVLQVAHPEQYPAPFASGIRQYAKIVGVKE